MSEFEDKLGAILSNPDAMGQIMSLAQSLGGGQGDRQPDSSPEGDAPPPSSGGGDLLSSLGNLDPRILQAGMKLFSEYNTGDNRNAALLAALRPFVKESRYAKVDRAVQVAKLSRIIRVALEFFKKEGGSDV